MSRGDDVKRVKRLSRKYVPGRREQEIPLRNQDPRNARRSARGEILRALEEEEEDHPEDEEFWQEAEEGLGNGLER
ncbi:MAG: hypothetical protein ACE5JS_01580 [Nitrospinota bacterium]